MEKKERRYLLWLHVFRRKKVMRIISLVRSAFAFAAMTSVAQAEPTVMKLSEPMRLTAPQMNNITAGGLTVFSYASGNELSYSRSIDFSITPHPDTLIAAACCGPGTIFAGVAVIPGSTRLDPIDLLDQVRSFWGGGAFWGGGGL
jgi:hypothetical protein